MLRLQSHLLAYLCFSFFSITATKASDHFDGEISIKNPVADITDVFTFISPDDPNRLVLILNSYPFVSRKGHFSNRLVYSFVVKEAALSGSGSSASIETKGITYRIDCTFDTPHNNAPHRIHCQFPNDKTASTNVDQPFSAPASSIKLFAGKRADPFLFSSSWFSTLVFDDQISKANATNDLTRMNVLSIVVDMDIQQVLGMTHKPLLAVAGEIAKRGANSQPTEIIDRAARPEISNAHLVTSTGQKDLRADYNSEHTFSLTPAHRSLYSQRISENIDYYDNLDGVTDWLPEWKASLVNLLVHDYLVIDTSKPFNNHSYFSIENALLSNQPHTRSGGRVPGENIIDKLMTVLIHGGHGIAINDGISQGNLVSHRFPYLENPNIGIISAISAYFAPSLTAKMALTERNVTKLK